MRFKYVLGLACGLALPPSVTAQTTTTPKPPPQSPPNQFQAAPATPYPTPLYRMNDVSGSLNLTQNQIGNLNKLTDQTQARYRDNYTKLGTLNETERAARLQELHRQYNTDWNKGAQDIFNDTQRSRYQQVNHQYGGFNTFYDPEVQKRLNLTADQMKGLGEQTEWSNQQMQDINRMGAMDATKGTQMYRDYWTQRQERFNKFLTQEQQKTWGVMTGEQYTFQPTFVPSR